MNKPGSSLSQFIEEYPLYSAFETDQPIEATDLDNLAFNFFCSKEKEIQPFRLGIPSSGGNGVHHSSYMRHTPDGFTAVFTGICKSCEAYNITVIVNSFTGEDQHRHFIRKIGQYPPAERLTIKIPGEVAVLLDEQGREFYRKALTCLDIEYGSGALLYFQKMLATGIDKIIENLSDPYAAEGDKFTNAFEAYKQDGQRTKFIEEAGSHVPPNLKEHAASILLVLHDALSISIGQLSEKECFKKSKDIDALYRYMARKINAEVTQPTQKNGPGKYFLRYS